MRFLFCVSQTATEGEQWANEGDPVIPNFPTGFKNSFLSLNNFLPTYKAIVLDKNDFSLNTYFEKVCDQFPGLPKEMLETYLLETASVAHQIDVNELCRCYTDQDSAKILNINTGEVYTLWEKQPIPELK